MYRCLQNKKVFINNASIGGLNYTIAKLFVEETEIAEIIISGRTQESVDKAITSLNALKYSARVKVSGIVGNFSDRLLTELPGVDVMIV